MYSSRHGDRSLYIGWSLVYLLVMAYIGAYMMWPGAVGAIVRCPVHELTGLECPTCGLTRAMVALLHGEPAIALRFNPLVVPAVILAVAFPLIMLVDGLCGTRMLPLLCRGRNVKRG